MYSKNFSIFRTVSAEPPDAIRYPSTFSVIYVTAESIFL